MPLIVVVTSQPLKLGRATCDFQAHPLLSCVGSVSLTMLACRSPSINASPTGPFTASATISPRPGMTGPYTVTATPLGGGTPVAIVCKTPTCPITGLKPGVTYDVSATGVGVDGKPTLPSSASTITMPAAG